MNAGAETVLEARSVWKRFGDLAATSNVSFGVGRGELRAIIGPNGAGKSTLLNILSGRIVPDAGEVVFKGENIVGTEPHDIVARGLARSFQTTNIFPNLTVSENIKVGSLAKLRHRFSFYFGEQTRIGADPQQVADIVGLSSQLSLLAGTLSYGDQRALEIGICLACEPEVLLLDEPTAGMSPFETEQMARLVRKLTSENNLSVILVEHDMSVVFAVADTILVMHNGQVLAQDTPEKIKNNPAVRAVYLGEDSEC